MHDHSAVLIDLALAEDVGAGDVTCQFFTPIQAKAIAFVAVRSDGVISGVELAARVFSVVDPDLEVEVLIQDGSRVAAGALLIRVEGAARSILTAERTALNFLQRLSGIATLTAKYVEAVKGCHAQILDTRKTTPGYRSLEKKAVADGGGTNHRLGLYDRAMVKDNHLVAEASLEAIQKSIHELKSIKPEVEVELEADRLEQVRDFLTLEGVDYILLDNMKPKQLTEAVETRGERSTPRFEASGGVNLQTIRKIAETGVDFISVGSLTHSAPALDVGLDFTPLHE